MSKLLAWIGSLAAAFAVGAASAQTGVIGDDYVGCLSDAYFDAYEFAVTSRDWRRRDELMASVCYEIESLEYSIVKKSFMSVRIQVTVDGETLRLTTTTEAIR